MEHDDRLIGRVLTRREALAVLGAAGVAVVGADAGLAALRAAAPAPGLPSCVVRPQQGEGPFFVDEMLERSDIRSDPTDGSVREGVPLHLTIRVSRISGAGCAAFPGVLVDLWQCDALGVYSGARTQQFDAVGKRFLRGYQVTDTQGTARFTTIFPGWYQGRAVHIHFKLRTDQATDVAYDFTSQLYFDDAMTDRLLAGEPYASRGGRPARNHEDRLFLNGGEQLMVALAPAGGQSYAGTFDIGLQIA